MIMIKHEVKSDDNDGDNDKKCNVNEMVSVTFVANIFDDSSNLHKNVSHIGSVPPFLQVAHSSILLPTKVNRHFKHTTPY